MPEIRSHNQGARLRHALGFALLLAALAAFAYTAAPAGAGNIHPIKIGKTPKTPRPLCPQRPPESQKPQNVKRICNVMAKISGFQLRVGGQRSLMRAKKDGRIAAWAIDLSKPNKFERKAFAKLFPKPFGGDASARISILKKKKGGPRYKLLRQSPVLDLQHSLGSKLTVTLNHPLKIKKGQLVGLTTQTWVPAFTIAQYSPQSRWRASRSKKHCNPPPGAPAVKTRPQQKVGSTRQYGCIFTDRLIYWAYEVPGLH